MALSEDEADSLLGQLWAEFGGRHKNIREYFRRRFEEVRPYLLSDQALSEERSLLIGGYFTHEYSFEAAALFNPSMVPHPDQSNLAEGAQRFVLSLRATGEGHISSITFRSGVVDSEGNVVIDAPTPLQPGAGPNPDAAFEKSLFERKLRELNLIGRLQPGSAETPGGTVYAGRAAHQHQPGRQRSCGRATSKPKKWPRKP